MISGTHAALSERGRSEKKCTRLTCAKGAIMSRLLLGLVLTVIASIGNADAQDNLWSNACRLMAFSILNSDVSEHEEMFAKSLAMCNSDPRAVACFATKRMLEQSGKTVPKLTCPGAAAPPEPEIVEAEKQIYSDIFENFCALAATEILTGVVTGNLQVQIAMCNKNPDKSSCETTKEFVFQRNHGDTRGLTCE